MAAWESTGWEEALARLSKAEQRATFRRIWPQIRQGFCDLMRERFATRGGGRWGTDLVDTGHLRESLTRPSHPDFVAEVTDRTLLLGTRVPHARYLERYEVVPEEEVALMLEEVFARELDL